MVNEYVAGNYDEDTYDDSYYYYYHIRSGDIPLDYILTYHATEIASGELELVYRDNKTIILKKFEYIMLAEEAEYIIFVEEANVNEDAVNKLINVFKIK